MTVFSGIDGDYRPGACRPQWFFYIRNWDMTDINMIIKSRAIHSPRYCEPIFHSIDQPNVTRSRVCVHCWPHYVYTTASAPLRQQQHCIDCASLLHGSTRSNGFPVELCNVCLYMVREMSRIYLYCIRLFTSYSICININVLMGS